jgi:uncharacterized membrane protein
MMLYYFLKDLLKLNQTQTQTHSYKLRVMKWETTFYLIYLMYYKHIRGQMSIIFHATILSVKNVHSF